VLTWQELGSTLAGKLQRFLEAKYGIFASRFSNGSEGERLV